MFVALLEYRNTPILSLGVSPSQILNSRRCRGLIPMHESKLEPCIISDVADKIKINQRKIESYYNKNSKIRADLTKNDKVYFQNQNKLWEPGVIVEVHDSPRSYLVKGRDDTLYRRNKIMIRLDKSQNNNSKAFNDSSQLTVKNIIGTRQTRSGKIYGSV